MTTDPDIQSLSPRMRATMAGVYRDIEATNRMLYAESGLARHLKEAEYAERRAAMLEMGAASLAELVACLA